MANTSTAVDMDFVVIKLYMTASDVIVCTLFSYEKSPSKLLPSRTSLIFNFYVNSGFIENLLFLHNKVSNQVFQSNRCYYLIFI